MCFWVLKFQSSLNCKLTTFSHQLPIVNHIFLLWISVAVDEKRVEGEKRKQEQQISGILQRIRSWELEAVLFKWWNGSPKGPRLTSTQLVAKRSPPSESRGWMINSPHSTQLLNFFIIFFLLVHRKWSSEHELHPRVGIWTWQTFRERWGPENRKVVARHWSYFCL